MTDFPEPLVPPDLDLRDYRYMPLDVVRLRDSDLVLVVSAEEFRAAVTLWCVAWHQIPAGSLPKDDKHLAYYVGLGRSLRAWKKIRDGALRGFVECSDGRLYHPVICDKALEANERKVTSRNRTRKATEARQRNRDVDRGEQRNVHQGKGIEEKGKNPPNPPLTSLPTSRSAHDPPIRNGLDQPAEQPELWAIDERTGDPLWPHRHGYKMSDDPAVETERIVAWYGELVSEIFARPPRQPYAGKPSEGKLGDAETAENWVKRGFNAKFAGEIFRQALEDRRDDGDQPPRSLSYFENSVSAYIARNPSWFPQPRMFSDEQVAEIKAKNAAALTPGEQGAADLAKLKAMPARPRRAP